MAGWLALILAMLACSLPYRSITPSAGPQAVTSPPTAPASPTAHGAAAAPSSAPTTAPTIAYQPVFEPAGCAFDVPPGQTPQCGDLLVPENRARPDSPTIRLHVAVFRSPAAQPAAEPLVYLSGGPGSGALDLAGYLFRFGLGAVLDQRDLILFDQRGAGFSQPRLDCPERQALAGELLGRGLSAPENQAVIAGAFGRCRERLAGQGIDLGAYTSAASAADLADLARALGYPALDLYAVSYGTRLALTVLRDQPGLAHRVVLDSVLPPQANLYSELAANAERAFNAFFTEYAGSYPTLREDFYTLVDRLNAEPQTVAVRTGGQWVNARLDGGLLIDVLFVGLYNPSVTTRMPSMIYDTAAGDYGILQERVDLYFDEGTALGMQMAVQCNEEIPFMSEGDLAAAAAGVQPQVAAFYTASLRPLFAGCAGWRPAAPDPRENQPVASDTPVLILAGSLDPVTPPAWGRLTQASLPNAQFHEFPGHGHWVTRSSGEALRLALAFWQK